MTDRPQPCRDRGGSQGLVRAHQAAGALSPFVSHQPSEKGPDLLKVMQSKWSSQNSNLYDGRVPVLPSIHSASLRRRQT